MSAQFHRNPSPPTLSLLILLSFYISSISSANVYFSRGDLTVFAQTNYIFQIELNKPIPAPEPLTVRFSTGYTTPNGPLTTCLLNNNTISGCTCSGLECTIPLPQVTTLQTLSLEIGSITNPSEAGTVTFTLISTTLGTNAITNRRLEEAPIRIEYAIVEKPKVQEITSYTVRFKLSHAIPPGGKLTVKFPSTSTDQILPSTDTVVINYDYDNSTATYWASTEDDEKVGITEPFRVSGYSRPESSLTITLNNIENQQSVGQSGEIELRSLSKTGKGINRGVFKVNITQAGTTFIQNIDVTGSKVINRITQIDLGFRFDISFVDSSNGPYYFISIDLPIGFEVQNSVFCSLSGGLVTPNMDSLYPQCQKSGNNTFLLAYVIYNSPNSPTTVSVTGIKSPSSTRVLQSPVNVTVYQSSTASLVLPRLIAIGSYDWKYSADPGNLTINGITRNSSTLGDPVLLTFSFNLPDSIDQGSKLILEIPNDQASFSGTPVCERVISGLSVNMACTIEVQDTYFKITATLCQTSAVCTTETNVIVKIHDNTFNPNYIRLTQIDSIRIYTTTQDGTAFYHSNPQGLFLSPNLIPMIPGDLELQKLGPEYQIVNKPFSFSMIFSPNSNILSGGYVYLYFPKETVFAEDDSLVACNYVDSGINSDTEPCIINKDSTGSYIQMIGMPICQGLSETCVSPLTFTIDGLKNPPNTKPIVEDSVNFWAIETGLSSTQRIDYKRLNSELPDTKILPNDFTINSFNISDDVVGHSSEVTLNFGVATPIPSNDIYNSRIIITIPGEVSLLPESDYPCQARLLPDISLTCKENITSSPKSITITQDTPNSQIPENSQIEVIIPVTNPPNTKSSTSFTIKSVSNINSVDYPLDTYIENNLNIIATPNTFTDYSLTVDPPIVGSNAQNIFAFTPSTSIPPSTQLNSRIVIELPSTMSLLTLSNPPSCTASTSTIKLACSYQPDKSPQTIQISHTQDSNALGGTPITVIVPPGVLRSPTSTKPTDSIVLKSISTVSGKDYLIDQLSGGFINDQVTQPGPITSYSAWKNSSRVLKYTDLTISFVPVNSLSNNSVISVSLPKEQVNLAPTLDNLQAFYQNKLIPFISSSENDTFIDFSIQTPCYSCPSNISFNLKGLINPSEANIPTTSLQLYTKTLGEDFLIDSITSDFFTLPRLTSGSLTNFAVNISSWIVGNPVDISLSFISNTVLSSQAELHVTFSNNLYFDIGNGISCKNSITKPYSPIMCVPQYGTSDYPDPVTNITVLLSSQCKSTCLQGTKFSILIQGLRNNFAVTPSTGTISISTYENDMALDSSSIDLRTLGKLVPGALSVLLMQRSEDTIAKQTEIQVKMQTSTLMIPGSLVQLTFLNSNQLALVAKNSMVCSLSDFDSQQVLRSLPCSSTGNGSLVLRGLCDDTSCAGGSKFAFTIQGLANVDYVKTPLTSADTVKMSTTDSRGYLSDQAQNIPVTPTLVVNSLTLIKSSLNDRTVQSETEWTLSVSLGTPLHATSQFVIQLPDHTLYRKSSTSSVLCYTEANLSLDCDTETHQNEGLDISKIRIKNMCSTATQCQANSTILIKFQGIKNPPALYQDSTQITLTTFNPDSNGDLQTADVLVGLWPDLLGPLSAGNITIISFTENLPHSGVLTNLTFVFSNENPIPDDSKIVLTLPDSFIIPDFVESEAKCLGLSGFSSSLQCNKQGTQLTLTNAFEPSQQPAVFAFTLLDVLNPKNQTQPSQAFTLTGFTIQILSSQNLLIETSSPFDYYLTPLNKDLTCTGDCLTCVGTSSNCTSCSAPSTSPLLSSNTCVSSCPSGSTMGTGVCIPCYAGCSSCTGPNKNECLICQPSMFLLDGACVSKCPSTTVQDPISHACLNKANCTGGCSLCSETSSFCIGCPTSKVLDPKTRTCIDPSATSCSPPYYYDQTSKECKTCNAYCKSCESSPSQCTTCSPQFNPLLDTTKTPSTCTTACPNSTFISSDKQCIACDSTCRSCSGPFSTECTSCSNNSFLEYGKCVQACSPGYTLDPETKQCVLPCTDSSCYKCQEADLGTCLTCKDGFLLDGTSCKPVDSCPAGQYLSASKTCESCNPSCKTCSGSPGNCTSCHTDFTLPVAINPNNLEFLYKGKCLQTCPLDTSANFANDKQCEEYECKEPCEFCSGASKKCFTCASATPYKYNNYCYATCPKGTRTSVDSISNELMCLSLDQVIDEPGKPQVIEGGVEGEITPIVIVLIIATILAVGALIGLNVVSRIKRFDISNRDCVVVLLQTLEVLSKIMLIPNVWGQEEGFLFFTVFTLMFNVIIGINFNALYLPVYENYVPTVKNYMELNKKTGKTAKALTYIGGSNMTKFFKSGLTGNQAQFEKIPLFREIQQKHTKVGIVANLTQAFIDILILATVAKSRDAFGIAVFNMLYNLLIGMGFFTQYLKARIIGKKGNFFGRSSREQPVEQRSS